MVATLDIASLIKRAEAVTPGAPLLFGINPQLAEILKNVIQNNNAVEVSLEFLQKIELWELDAAENYLSAREEDVELIERLGGSVRDARPLAKAARSFC